MDDDTPKPWDRRDTETAKAFAAFVVYRDLGHKRSLAKACAVIYEWAQKGLKRGSIPSHIRRWCSRHAWVERSRAWDIQQDKDAQAYRALENRQLARERAEQLYPTIKQALDAFTAGLDDMRSVEAARAFKVLFDAERVARGMTTEVHETRHADANGNTLPTLTPEAEAERFAQILNILSDYAAPRPGPPAPDADADG